jgi:hypothetical protein
MLRPDALDPYLTRLRELPFVVDARVEEREPGATAGAARRKYRADAAIRVDTPTGPQRCFVEHKQTHLSAETAQHLVTIQREVPELMVFAPHVGRDLGELFTRERVNFIDLSGNCHVRFGDRYLARVQGNTPTPQNPADKGMRAASYEALLALLIDPELLDGTTRAIASAAGDISPQTAADLRARLVEQGLLLRTRRHHRWSPTGRKHALDLWLTGWTSTLFPRLLVGRFRARTRDLPVLESQLAAAITPIAPWRWGGGAAAQRLTQFYRGEQTVLYVEQPPADLAKRLALVPDRAGPVVLARSPGPLAFRGPHPETVHPLLIYADLLAEGHDRAREAAAELSAQLLTPHTESP